MTLSLKGRNNNSLKYPSHFLTKFETLDFQVSIQIIDSEKSQKLK